MKQTNNDEFVLTRNELADMVSFWDFAMPILKKRPDLWVEAVPDWTKRFKLADKLLLAYLKEEALVKEH